MSKNSTFDLLVKYVVKKNMPWSIIEALNYLLSRTIDSFSNNNGIIQLISFNTFKQKEQTEANKSNEVIDEKKPKRKLKKGEIEYSFVGLKDVPSPVLPGPNDTVRIYLDKIQLQLRNDTLYCVGSDKLPEEAKFYRAKNNR